MCLQNVYSTGGKYNLECMPRKQVLVTKLLNKTTIHELCIDKELMHHPQQ